MQTSRRRLGSTCPNCWMWSCPTFWAGAAMSAVKGRAIIATASTLGRVCPQGHRASCRIGFPGSQERVQDRGASSEQAVRRWAPRGHERHVSGRGDHADLIVDFSAAPWPKDLCRRGEQPAHQGHASLARARSFPRAHQIPFWGRYAFLHEG